MNKLLFLLAITITIISNSFSQDVTVFNSSTGKPVSNINVYNNDRSISYFTDSNGIISLNEFKINELIYFSHSSFIGEKKTIAQIIENDYKVYLSDIFMIEPFVIKAPRESTYEDFSSVRMEKISIQEMRFSIPQTSADMLQKNANILVQKFVAEANGADIRCIVLGNKVLGAVQRRAADGDFRSNLHQRGKIVKVKITKKERLLAIKAAKVMGLRFAGVDMLRSDDGPKVLEVNSTPGLEGLETVTGVDIAGEVVEYVARYARLPAGVARRKRA